jgi:type II secretory pathway pseudopilin PulG
MTVFEAKSGRPVAERTSGFSLLEMLIVLSFVAAAAVIVAPWSGRSMDAVVLRTAATQLANNLNLTRVKAMQDGRPMRLEVDPLRGIYAAEGVIRPHVLPRGVVLALETAGGISRDPFGVSFDADGRSDAAVVLVSGGRGAAIRVAVDGLSGFASASVR